MFDLRLINSIIMQVNNNTNPKIAARLLPKLCNGKFPTTYHVVMAAPTDMPVTNKLSFVFVGMFKCLLCISKRKLICLSLNSVSPWQSGTLT